MLVASFAELQSWAQRNIIKKTIACIGNFDGCHLGHQALLRRCQAEAARAEAQPLVISFHPRPELFFQNRQGYSAEETKDLFTLAQKKAAFHSLGLEHPLFLKFNQNLSMLSHIDFYELWLKKTLRCVGLVIGEDFCFGKGRLGTLTWLQEQARVDLSFQLSVQPKVLVEGHRSSSSAIRKCLVAGDIGLANQLLGRPYALEGVLEAGDGLGRQFGTPTFNLALPAQLVPAHGIYAGYMYPDPTKPVRTMSAISSMSANTEENDILHFNIEKLAPIVLHIGPRPSLQEGLREAIRVEAHVLLDAAGSGSFVQICNIPTQVRFYCIAKIRDIETFTSLTALQAAIEEDIVCAKALLARYASLPLL